MARNGTNGKTSPTPISEPDQVDAILGPLVVWLEARQQLAMRLTKARAAHATAQEVMSQALRQYEDTVDSDPHALDRARLGLSVAREAEADLAARLAGAQRASDQHVSREADMLRSAAERFHTWLLTVVGDIERQYAASVASVVDIARQALALGLAAGNDIAGISLPTRAVLDGMLPEPFVIPTVIMRTFSASDRAQIGFGGLPGIDSDASRIASAVMAILLPLARTAERREATAHTAAVRLGKVHQVEQLSAAPQMATAAA
jgi:hypothetical protein